MRRTARAVAIAVFAAAGLVGGLAVPSPAQAAPQCRQPKEKDKRLEKKPWNVQRFHTERAHKLSKGGFQLVAVIDSGIDKNHPLLDGFAGKATNVSGGSTSAHQDCIGHGTMVAGIIAADSLDPWPNFHGVAPKARLMSIKQTPDGGQGHNKSGVEALVRGIITAAQAGARVINISITTDQNSPQLREAVKYAVRQGSVVVAAAGNNKIDNSGVVRPGQTPPKFYPAAYGIPGVLAVGAIGPDGKRAQVSHARSYVDVAAPGGKGIVSTGPNGPGYFTESPDGGTSFAAPYVSGTVALVRAYRPHLSPAQVAELIKESASPAPDGVGLGAGVVNPYAALTMQLPGVEVTTNPAPRPAGYAPPSDPTDELNVTLMAALGTTAGGVLVGFVVIGLGVALPRGSRRRWRPGRRAAPQPEEPAEEEEAPPLPGAVLGGSPSGE